MGIERSPTFGRTIWGSLLKTDFEILGSRSARAWWAKMLDSDSIGRRNSGRRTACSSLLATVEIIFHCTYSFNIGKQISHLWIQERNRRECKDIGKVLFRYIVHTYASSKDFVVEMVSAMRVVFWDLYFGSSASAAFPEDCPYLPGPNLVSLANETNIGCSHGVPFVQEQSVVPIKRISWVLSLALAKHKTGCHQPVNGK
jgi:hypothetical protein